jgi:hypothetical protein
MTVSALLEQATFQEQRGFMATDKVSYTAVEVNGLTGETTERELTDEEIANLPERSNDPIAE